MHRRPPFKSSFFFGFKRFIVSCYKTLPMIANVHILRKFSLKKKKNHKNKKRLNGMEVSVGLRERTVEKRIKGCI